MPDLVNLDERYHLLGVAPIEREDNSELDGRTDQHVEPQVVYTTNDLNEAKSICRAGGWVQHGQFMAVSGYRDTQRITEPGEGQPLKRNVPHNVDQA